MNPLSYLFVIAPVAVLAAFLFMNVYQSQSSSGEIHRAKIEATQLQFDKDFASAWNSGSVEAPEKQALELAKARVIELENAKKAAEEERAQKLAELAKQMEKVLVKDDAK